MVYGDSLRPHHFQGLAPAYRPAAATCSMIWHAKFPLWRAWCTKYRRPLGQRLSHSRNVVAISKLLGHAQLTTTQRYVDHLAVASASISNGDRRRSAQSGATKRFCVLFYRSGYTCPKSKTKPPEPKRASASPSCTVTPSVTLMSRTGAPGE